MNLSIAPNKTITAITNKSIYFFSPKGKLNKKITNTHNLNLIDSTSYSNFILGSTKSNSLYKFTELGTPLFSESLLSLKEPPTNLNIYKPYGDFILFNENEGAYYSMKTSLKINSCTQTIMKKNLSISCKIKLNFPSTIQSKINKINTPSYKLTPYKLNAGNHSLIWKNVPLKYKDPSIEFLTKGLYSNQNTIKKTYKLNVKK